MKAVVKNESTTQILMFLVLFVLVLGSRIPQNMADLYGQCGGQEFNGPTSYSVGSCRFQNPYYSQCLNEPPTNPSSDKPNESAQTHGEPGHDPSPFAGEIKYTAKLTTRDDECIKDHSKCGAIDPGALGRTPEFPLGRTQCGTDPLTSNIIGLDSMHFGTDQDGVITHMCGKTVTITNPKNGKSVQAVVSDRIPVQYGGGESQVNSNLALTRALGADQDGGLNIAEVVVSY